MKLATPRYCRISRLIRDIPEPNIEAGNKVTNLRQDLAEEMKKRGLKCKCLRCREVGHNANFKMQNAKCKMFVDKYKTTGGDEYFISFEDEKRKIIFAFLRLRLPNNNHNSAFCILHSAFIRELHTYGQLVGIGKDETKASQHKGLGKKLVQEAEHIARKNKFKKLAVISGVGVRGYYRKLEYKKEGTYMVKSL
jgi:elongator complex protein 3